MNLHTLIFTNCDSYKAAIPIKPIGIMVHSTGANNPNLCRYVGPDDGLLGKNQYNNHYNMPKVGKSVHAFIGKLKDGTIATYQVLPFDYKSGHCYYSGNSTHLSFEICEDDTKDPVYFNKVYKEAVEFTAMLCKKFGFDPMADGVVIDHSEGYKRKIASNHGDVKHWFTKHGKSMDTFRADVKALLGGESVGDKMSATENKTEAEGYTMNMRNLKRGSRGEDVRALQILLAGRGYNGKMGKPDGIFGPNTEGAVKLCQKANGLTVDGIAGPKTMGKLLGV